MADPAPRGAGEDRPLRVAPDEKPFRPAPSGPAESPRRGSRALVVLAIALAAFAGYLGWRTAELQRENRVLSGELSTARAALDAHRAHLAGARERAAGLRGQLDELEAFLARDPAAAQ
jgi:hypothetical protein